MKKHINFFTFLFLFVFLINSNLFAESTINKISSEDKSFYSNANKISRCTNNIAKYVIKDNRALSNISLLLAPPAPPTVNGFQYYCLNDSVGQLTATPSAGGTLNWYGTNATGGTASAIAPTPSTATATPLAGITYYVSQTVAGEESSRASITVNVNKQLALFCKRVTPTSVEFDFANVGQTSFNYSYTVSGGAPITGIHSSPSNFTVAGLSSGQSVVFTITAVGARSCVTPSQTATCVTTCLTTTIPTFAGIPTSYCLNDVPPVLPTTSTNVPPITGTWNPAVINTAVAGTNSYVFTPNSVLSPCATTTTLIITVGPVTPNFTDLTMCSGETAPILNTTSPNGIVGTWSPATIDNTTSGSYVFTPSPGQACSPTVKTILVTVNPSNAIVSLSWTVAEAFAKNQIVTVTDPVGANYTYQLDDGPFQADPIFEYVSAGTHSITVQHVDGCSVFTNNNVVVINYPKYFTPNNDGFNDTWNIITLANQNTSRIVIFDRFGKFLKEIRPGGNGWDGTYTGQPMPANDYWFSVEYVEDSVAKKFNSHFSLKR